MFKKILSVKLVFVLILLTSLILIAGCSNDKALNENKLIDLASYNVIFTVLNESDSPLEGAETTLDGASDTTNSEGLVTFSKPDGTYNYEIIASGYESISGKIIVDGAEITETVNLLPGGYIYIYNWEDLNNVRNDLSADYILMNDLDSNTEGYEEYSSSTANNGQGWKPIGNGTSTYFQGHLMETTKQLVIFLLIELLIIWGYSGQSRVMA